MGLQFVFKETENGKGYVLNGVKGVVPGGEYDVLEIPSSYNGKPVIGIMRIDPELEDFPYRALHKKRPHFKHLIFPRTLGRFPKDNWQSLVGCVDKLTMRGWSMDVNTDKDGVYYPSHINNLHMEVDTLVFEGSEIPPKLFCDTEGTWCKIDRILVPNVKTIGEYAFSHSAVTELKLPEGLKTIGRGAFVSAFIKSDVTYADTLRDIKIPSTVTYIGPAAFKPQQVDRASLRGRNWEFAVPPKSSGESGYTQKLTFRMVPDDLWERKANENVHYIHNGADIHPFSRWLNAEKVSQPGTQSSSYPLGYPTPESEEIWNRFLKNRALMCGPEKKPSGVWFHR